MSSSLRPTTRLDNEPEALVAGAALLEERPDSDPPSPERIPPEGATGLGSGREPVVRAVSLTKRYGGTLALKDLSLTLLGGEIFGLVGPNGAGKTTLLRILATLTRPDSGEATICGHPLDQVRAVRSRIGFMPDVLGVYDDMLVREYFEFFARACHLPEATRDYAIQETMRLVGIETLAEQGVEGLSRGMKQRLALGRALLHGPRVLLLDEPASGLDPLARLELREILRRLQRQGVSILISSHVLEDLAEMCDRVGILSRGSMVCVQETRDLIEMRGGRFVRARALGNSEDLFDFLAGRSDIEGLRWDNQSLVFQVKGGDEAELARLVARIVGQGISLVAFSEELPSLESAYLNLTRAAEGWEVSP
jgi:ABC-2 type transport system ATP-binding protein